MTEAEQIYALLVEANPVSDPASIPETLQEAIPRLHVVPKGRDEMQTRESTPMETSTRNRRGRSWIVGLAAAAVIIVVGATLLLLASGEQAETVAPMPPPTTEVPGTTIDPATQAAVEIAEHAVDVWNNGDVAAFQALFREDGAINFLQASGTHVRDHMAFLMAIDDRLALESCQPASDGAVIECSGTNTDQLTEGAGLIVDATWTFKIDNGHIVRLDWRRYSDPRKEFIEEIGNWLPTAHPEIWAETFALPERCRAAEAPDCTTGTWYATPATAAVLLELVPEFIAGSPVYPLTG